MRILSQIELARLSKPQLHGLLHQMTLELPYLPEGSPELQVAHANLLNIRRMLARPEFRPR